jgi:hypothetical protein
MKTYLRTLALAAALSVGLFTATASDKSAKATPGGGRLLEKTTPHAELVIEKDRSITINFYTDDMKPVAVTTQSATVIATTTSGKTTIEFEKRGDSLASKTKLPEGADYNLVVQFKQTADAKPQNFRFKLDLATCGECKRAEYACSCGH